MPVLYIQLFAKIDARSPALDMNCSKDARRGMRSSMHEDARAGDVGPSLLPCVTRHHLQAQLTSRVLWSHHRAGAFVLKGLRIPERPGACSGQALLAVIQPSDHAFPRVTLPLPVAVLLRLGKRTR